jgi:probable addiction module antidote protein
MRSLEISINGALRTADVHAICAAIDAAIHKSPHVSSLAEEAGLDRSWLYRAFRSKQIGPRLDHAIKILSALGFRLVVEFVRRGPLQKSNVHLELASSRMAADYLTRIFENSEICTIVKAFSDVLRAQENVGEVAEKTVVTRANLYRAFRAPHDPSLKTVVSFLHALGLRLAVKQLPNRVWN